MTARNIIRLTCDICGDESANYNNIDEAKSAGWVLASVANRHLDRSYADKHICDECALGISQIVAKRGASK